MNWEYGLLLGAVGFIAYHIGYQYAKWRAANIASVLLSVMDKDMDGAVRIWFETKGVDRAV